jgi:predicted ferric reductase
MKYRGIDARVRRVIVSLFLVGTLGILVATADQTTGAIARWLGAEVERLPWYAMRILGLFAYGALAGSVIYGLLLSTHVLDPIAHRTNSFTLHQDLSSIGLGLATLHAALLLIDRSVPFTAFEILVPFAAPYRPLWVGLGQIGLFLAGIVVISFHVRRRIGQRNWRRLHYVTFGVFLAATAHGLVIGTDSRTPWVFWGYIVCAASVAFLMTYRIVVAVVARRQSAARPRAAAGVPEAGNGDPVVTHGF